MAGVVSVSHAFILSSSNEYHCLNDYQVILFVLRLHGNCADKHNLICGCAVWWRVRSWTTYEQGSGEKEERQAMGRHYHSGPAEAAAGRSHFFLLICMSHTGTKVIGNRKDMMCVFQIKAASVS